MIQIFTATFFSDSKAVLYSLVISLTLIVLNVYVYWFILHELTRHQLLDTDKISLPVFRIIVGVCQTAGSLLCLTLVDFIERKVNSFWIILLAFYYSHKNVKYHLYTIIFYNCWYRSQFLLVASIAGITATEVIYEILGTGNETHSWISIVLIAMAAFCLHFGVFPLTFILLPEIIPEHVWSNDFIHICELIIHKTKLYQKDFCLLLDTDIWSNLCVQLNVGVNVCPLSSWISSDRLVQRKQWADYHFYHYIQYNLLVYLLGFCATNEAKIIQSDFRPIKLQLQVLVNTEIIFNWFDFLMQL